jgi:hypothetical protein
MILYKHLIRPICELVHGHTYDFLFNYSWNKLPDTLRNTVMYKLSDGVYDPVIDQFKYND